MSDYISKINTKKDDGFNKGYEQYYREKFRLYLSGVQRYMMNKRLKEEPYHGENGAIEHE